MLFLDNVLRRKKAHVSMPLFCQIITVTTSKNLHNFEIRKAAERTVCQMRNGIRTQVSAQRRNVSVRIRADTVHGDNICTSSGS